MGGAGGEYCFSLRYLLSLRDLLTNKFTPATILTLRRIRLNLQQPGRRLAVCSASVRAGDDDVLA